MIRRTPKQRALFSATMFLEPSPPRITKKSRIDHWLLLLLRCLVVLLIALAFGRPFLKETSASTQEVAEGRVVVLLVDRSASMKRETLWEQARSKAASLLRELEPEDTAAIGIFDEQARILLGFEEWRRAERGARVDLGMTKLSEIEPSWRHTDVGLALMTAAELFQDFSEDEEEGRIREKAVHLISDFQSGARFENLLAYDWPQDVPVSVDRIEAPSGIEGNARIQWAPVEEMLGDDEQAAQARVLVSNDEDSASSTFQVYWQGHEDEAVTAVAPPGQSRVIQSPSRPDSGEVLVLFGDEHSFDNRAYVSMPESEKALVLFQGPDEPDDPNEMLFYLRRAFVGSVRPSIEVVNRKHDQLFTQEEINLASLLVVAGSIVDTSAIQGMLKGGKSVLVVGTEALASPSFIQLPGLDRPFLDKATIKDYALIGEMEFGHPVFSFFVDPKFSDFTTIHFWSYARLREDGFPSSSVLSRFDNGDPVLLECHLDGGTMFALASGWNPEASQFSRSTKFVPFLFSLLEYRGVRRSVMTQYVVGERLPVRAVLGGERGGIEIAGPDGFQEALRDGDVQSKEIEAPGVYHASLRNRLVKFAVNTDPREGHTTPLEVDHLDAFGIPTEAQESETGLSEEEAIMLANSELEGKQKWWQKVLALTILLLVLESWLAGRLSRAPQTA